MRGRARRDAVLAILTCSMFVLSTLPYVVAAAVSSATTSSTTRTTSTSPAQVLGATPTSLVLSVVPPKLPADGGTYPAIVVSLQSPGGKASVALNDTVVFLTSSQESVGTVSYEVTIPRGAGFAVANFTTSATPGTSSISASSVGLSAISAQVTSVTPSGFATHLKVMPVPGSQIVNPSGTGTIVVETLDSAGSPAKASLDIEVTLSSSNNNVVSIPSTALKVANGSVLSSATYDIGVSPGVATITASASGFNSGSGTVTVQGPSPFALKISAQPDPMVTSSTGRLVVTLTDPQGDPARAPSAITVTISSSNTSIISVTSTARIPTGQVYAVASFVSEPIKGNANLTASAPGLKSDYAVVAVTNPVQPAKLKLIVSPNPVLADKGAYDAVVVSLTDAVGNPAVASSDVNAVLTSSNAAVGSVDGSLDIPPGANYEVATFSSTFFVGSTTITAQTTNLLSASAVVTSYGPIPAKVVVQALPPNLPADGRDYAALEVMLQDASGLPAVAPVGVAVQLASSRTDIATVNSSVVIGAGQTYVLTDVVTSISPGIANITASSSGYESSSTGFSTTSPAPSQLGLYIAPASGIQSLGRSGDAILAVQLQDSSSSPARARQDTQIVVTSSNSSVIAKPIQIDIPSGRDYVSTFVKTSDQGSSVLTASTGGLSSASASLTELTLPVSITLTSSAPVVTIGTPATMQLQVQVLGAPLAGAAVSFAATSGAVSPSSGVTDSTGQLTGTFIPQQNGVATITALVTSALLGNLTAGTNVLVTLPGSPGAGAATARGSGALLSLVPIAIVVVVVVIIAFGVRRMLKARRAGGDEDEEKEPGEK